MANASNDVNMHEQFLCNWLTRSTDEVKRLKLLTHDFYLGSELIRANHVQEKWSKEFQLTNCRRCVIVQRRSLWSDWDGKLLPVDSSKSMSNVVRRISVAILCTIIACGQLPALLHLAACHHSVSDLCELDACPTTPSPPIASFSKCHCHCHPPLANKGATNDCPTDEGPADHDADSCLICQSLLAPSLTEQFEIPAVFGDQYCGSLLHSPPSSDAQSSISIAVPRGPPGRHTSLA